MECIFFHKNMSTVSLFSVFNKKLCTSTISNFKKFRHIKNLLFIKNDIYFLYIYFDRYYYAKMIKIQVNNVDMFYDVYESEFGDGFYPVTQLNNSCKSKIRIGFHLITNQYKEVYWKQIYNDVDLINGLDVNEGALLLAILNKRLNADIDINKKNAIKGIANKWGIIIYQKNGM